MWRHGHVCYAIVAAHASHHTFLLRQGPTDRDEGANLNLVWHAAVDFHKLLDAEALEWRYNRLELFLNKNGVETVLIANRFEDVQLNQREAVPLAVLELLEELRLCLIIEICVLDVLNVFDPDS